MGAKVTDAIPAEVHGFKVEITHGPLKSQQTGLTLPGRHAVYATLTPTTPKLARKLREHGSSEAILGQVEIVPQLVDEMQRNERAREFAASMALVPAAKLAKQVADAV